MKSVINFLAAFLFVLITAYVITRINAAIEYKDKPYETFDTKQDYKGYKDLLVDIENGDISFTSGGIPKAIYKTSWHKRNEFPLEVIKSFDDTIQMNPEYKLYYFDNDEVNAFVKGYSDEAYKALVKLIPGAYKADLFRYCILDMYGGCYTDVGHAILKPFDEICGDANMVLVKDLNNTGIHNALMCTVKKQDMIKALVSASIQNIRSNFYGVSSLDITGPILLGKVFLKYTDGTYNDDFRKIFFGTKKYKCDKCHVKMLKLVHGNKIIDANNVPLIIPKFKDYYNIMYDNMSNDVKKLHYSILWHNRNVYNTTVTF